MADTTDNVFNEDNLENLKESIDYSRILIDNAKLLIKLNRDSGHTLYEGFKTASTALSKSLDKINLNYSKYQKFEIKRKEIQKDISNIQKYQNQLIDKRQSLEKGELVTLERNLKLQEAKELKALQNLNKTKISSGGKYKRNESVLQDEKKKTDELKKQVGLLTSSLDLSKDLEAEASKQLDTLEEYSQNLDSAQKKISVAKGLLNGLAKIPILGGFIDAEKGIEKMEQQALLKNGFWSSLAKSISTAFSTIAKATVILAVVEAAFKIFEFIKDAMFAADKQITDIARKMNITKEAAGEIRKHFAGISIHAQNLATIEKGIVVSQKDIFNIWTEINDQLGTATELGDRFLVQMSIASTKIGLSQEAMRGLALYTKQSGVESQDILGSISATNNLQKLQGKSLIENKKLLESTLKTTGYIRSTFKGSVTELAKGVAQAHLMGTTLEKINSIADGFLDFESSISSELEAQLLTGRDINLDAARYYAVTNQTANLMKEIQNTFPSWEDFNKQNRIAAEAQAKAVGMTKDELSDTIFEQQTLNKLKSYGIASALKGADLEKFKQIQSSKEAYDFLLKRVKSEKEISNLIDEQAYKRLQSISAEEKFNQAIEKLKEAFSNVFTGEMIDKLADAFVGFTNALSKGISGLFNIGDEIKKSHTDRLTKGAFEKVQGNENTTSNLKAAVRILGNDLTQDIVDRTVKGEKIDYLDTYYKIHHPKSPVKNDFISRDGNITSFRKDDLIIGGTSLLNSDKGMSKNSEELTQLKELNNNIKYLIGTVEKGHDIVMDSYKVGSTVSMASTRIQ